MEGLKFITGGDWGSETHQVCVVDSDGGVLAERAFTHGGAGLAEISAWIVTKTSAEAGAKDDRRDALALADALRTDRHAFRRLDAAAPEIVELREWSRIAHGLTCDRTLNNPPAPHPDVLHHAPIRVLLAVLETLLAAHEHGRSVRRFDSPIKGVGRHYSRIWRSKARKTAASQAKKSSN